VESRFVIDQLVDKVNAALPAARNYAVVHADTGDARGIDVAFIYDDTLFQVCRHAIREIVQVNFRTTTAAGGTWAVLGNHWPSRIGGQLESEGYRAIAEGRSDHFHQRMPEMHGLQTPGEGGLGQTVRNLACARDAPTAWQGASAAARLRRGSERQAEEVANLYLARLRQNARGRGQSRGTFAGAIETAAHAGKPVSLSSAQRVGHRPSLSRVSPVRADASRCAH
jgi:hypothetical protein